MMVDVTHHDDRLSINVDIEFPKMPCELLSLDVQDIMGTHIVDIAGSLYKKHLSADGKVIGQQSMFDMVQSKQDLIEKVKRELDQRQGCRLEGFF